MLSPLTQPVHPGVADAHLQLSLGTQVKVLRWAGGCGGRGLLAVDLLLPGPPQAGVGGGAVGGGGRGGLVGAGSHHEGSRVGLHVVALLQEARYEGAHLPLLPHE